MVVCLRDFCCSELFFAAAHRIGRLPPGGVVHGPGHVASRVSAAFEAEAFRAKSVFLALAPCILEGTFVEATRKGSAGEVLAFPLLAVVGWERHEAVVVFSAELQASSGSFTVVKVLVRGVVCAHEELFICVVCRPGEMAGGARGITTVIEAFSNLSNNDVRGLFAIICLTLIGIVDGPPEVRELGVVLTAGSRANLTTDDVVNASIEIADHNRHAAVELVRDGPEEV